jgi:hypothetical protein
MSGHCSIYWSLLVKPHRGSGDPARKLGNGKQSIHSVQRATRNGNTDDGQLRVHNHYPGKSSGKTGYTKQYRLCAGSLKVVKILNESR